MNKIVLITRPNYDITTNYFYEWSESIITLAVERRDKVLDLHGKKANRKAFESYANKHHPNLFFLNGHGSDVVLAGYNHEPILISGDNDSLCFDSIVYIRSCSAGNSLANALVNQKARACIGYTTKFGFMRLVDRERNPLSDELAELFLEPSNTVITTLLKGHTVMEAHRRSIEGMKRNLHKMLSSDNSFSDSTSIMLLCSNMRGQIVVGDSSATI
jgi:hypothetical protein